MTHQVTHQLSAAGKNTARLLRLATAVLAIVIFSIDAKTRGEFSVSVLYVAVVLLAARFFQTRRLLLVSAGCACLTVLAYFVAPTPESDVVAVVNTLLSLVANGVTTFLVLRSQSAEFELRERASLLDLSHDTVFSRSMDDVISYWNRGAEELYGWKKEEAVGKVVHELLGTTFPAPVGQINAELLRMDRWEGELVHKKRDGTPVVVAGRWSLQRGEQGRPTAILETNNDITERKQAQEALLRAQADIARFNRVMLLGEMTASIAHEVNQPISAANTNASAGLRWLAAQPPDLEEAREALERINRDCDRASEVIARVRALVKKAPPRKDTLDINEAIREVIALTTGELQRNNVKLLTYLSNDLPVVPADRVQVQQVILNLIINAVEAMSKVSERPRQLAVSSGESDKNDVFVEVRDSGPGLDAADHDRLFHSFYTTKPDGMGMGLALSRSIVQAHGGQLWAEPNRPHGAVFRFTLSVAEHSAGDSRPPLH